MHRAARKWCERATRVEPGVDPPRVRPGRLVPRARCSEKSQATTRSLRAGTKRRAGSAPRLTSLRPRLAFPPLPSPPVSVQDVMLRAESPRGHSRGFPGRRRRRARPGGAPNPALRAHVPSRLPRAPHALPPGRRPPRRRRRRTRRRRGLLLRLRRRGPAHPREATPPPTPTRRSTRRLRRRRLRPRTRASQKRGKRGRRRTRAKVTPQRPRPPRARNPETPPRRVRAGDVRARRRRGSVSSPTRRRSSR